MKVTIEYKADLDDLQIKKEAARLIKESLIQKMNKLEQNSLFTEVIANEN
jgi:hypothetical protein